MALNSTMSANSSEPDVEAGSWTAIVPIRSFTAGKTRLDTPGIATAALIRAFASDVLDACTGCSRIGEVVVVSPDPSVLEFARDRGVRELRETDAGGINEAIEYARGHVTGSIVAILGDTPCLTADGLTSVLDEAARFPISFVPDASGVGTTIWCSHQGSRGGPHFGHHSRAEHRASGAVEICTDNASPQWARARRDVDTDVDLWDARRLGVGPATSALLDEAT